MKKTTFAEFTQKAEEMCQSIIDFNVQKIKENIEYIHPNDSITYKHTDTSILKILLDSSLSHKNKFDIFNIFTEKYPSLLFTKQKDKNLFLLLSLKAENIDKAEEFIKNTQIKISNLKDFLGINSSSDAFIFSQSVEKKNKITLHKICEFIKNTKTEEEYLLYLSSLNVKDIVFNLDLLKFKIYPELINKNYLSSLEKTYKLFEKLLEKNSNSYGCESKKDDFFNYIKRTYLSFESYEPKEFANKLTITDRTLKFLSKTNNFSHGKRLCKTTCNSIYNFKIFLEKIGFSHHLLNEIDLTKIPLSHKNYKPEVYGNKFVHFLANKYQIEKKDINIFEDFDLIPFILSSENLLDSLQDLKKEHKLEIYESILKFKDFCLENDIPFFSSNQNIQTILTSLSIENVLKDNKKQRKIHI